MKDTQNDTSIQFLAHRIDERRQELGWNLTVTAERCGLSKAVLTGYRRHGRIPNGIALAKLSRGLGISIDSLFSWKEKNGKTI